MVVFSYLWRVDRFANLFSEVLILLDQKPVAQGESRNSSRGVVSSNNIFANDFVRFSFNSRAFGAVLPATISYSEINFCILIDSFTRPKAGNLQ